MEAIKDIIEVIFLFSLFPFWACVPIIASHITKEKVHIWLIELMSWTYLYRILLVFCEGFCCYLFITRIELLVDDFKDGIGAYIFLSFCIIIFALGIRKYFSRRYHCIVGCEYVNAKTLKRSIESETFRKINSDIWESDHWIRMKRKIYPKSLISDLYFSGVSNGGFNAIVYMVYSKEYWVQSVVRRYADTRNEEMKKTVASVPVSKLAERPGAYGISKKEFKAYVKNHTVEEIIYNTNLLRQVIDKQCGK